MAADHPEQRHTNVSSDVVSSTASEVAKAIAVAVGFDEISAAAVGGAASGLIKNAQPALAQLVARRSERLTEAIDEAEKYAPSIEDLVIRALEDDRKLNLLARALEAAQLAADSERVRFYGRIAAQGVLTNDDAQVDESQKVFSSIAALDPADLKVLLHFARRGGMRKRKGTGRQASIIDELPELEPIIDAAFAKLENLGLISAHAEGGLVVGASWRITEFGHLCVRRLHTETFDTDDA